MRYDDAEEEPCPCPTCERGEGPFKLPCEFQFQEPAGRHYMSGPRFVDNEFDLTYPYRTWEINWPEKCHIPWPRNLVGLMEFEWYEILESCQF